MEEKSNGAAKILIKICGAVIAIILVLQGAKDDKKFLEKRSPEAFWKGLEEYVEKYKLDTEKLGFSDSEKKEILDVICPLYSVEECSLENACSNETVLEKLCSEEGADDADCSPECTWFDLSYLRHLSDKEGINKAMGAAGREVATARHDLLTAAELKTVKCHYYDGSSWKIPKIYGKEPYWVSSLETCKNLDCAGKSKNTTMIGSANKGGRCKSENYFSYEMRNPSEADTPIKFGNERWSTLVSRYQYECQHMNCVNPEVPNLCYEGGVEKCNEVTLERFCKENSVPDKDCELQTICDTKKYGYVDHFLNNGCRYDVMYESIMQK